MHTPGPSHAFRESGEYTLRSRSQILSVPTGVDDKDDKELDWGSQPFQEMTGFDLCSTILVWGLVITID